MMDRDARKAIARRFGMNWPDTPECERYYPKCCQYHQGFDDALAEFCDDLASWSAAATKRVIEDTDA